MAGALVTAALIVGALLLTLVAPHALARWERLRTVPAQGLFLWQSVSLAGVAFALSAAPVAAATLGTDYPRLLLAALILSGLMLARLLWSGHTVGTELRRMRAEHRALVDLVGERLPLAEDGDAPSPAPAARHGKVSVLPQADPTAYCLPGRRDRIVLSRAALDRLGDEELGAVLAHEHAHLRQRHDLVLELFQVLHEAVPEPVRAGSALAEVRLLGELLADRGAARRVGAATVGRALVALVTPGSARQVRRRLAALAADPAPAWLRHGLPVLSSAVLALPVVLLALALWGS
ncbi:M56 family metallopeptidase [Ornithinimicrobium cerasi]|uniref:M56 family metallopeptidase n=1 Tax=Ornithinimicrobium cerasi TaxID=2248773 RepID=UPI000F00F206|nr:M56 family metallopeptidase [Ornithinimicrobium cerasi]